MAALMAQFKQSHSRGLSPKNTLTKDTPVKDKGRAALMPIKKTLMPDKTAEPPVKKQHTSSPSSEGESESEGGMAEKKKKKKKKVKSDPIVITDSEAEETEEQQEKCQRARKWKRELKALKEYCESCNIFLMVTALPARNGGSYTGYLASVLDVNPGHFFIQSIKDWKEELQRQSQGIRHSAAAACCRLNALQQACDIKLSTQYSMHAEYLVEVFKYPGTGNHIYTDSEDGYGSNMMIGLYGLVDLYSIAQITTTQSGVVGKDGKKKSTLRCYCSLCDYVVQKHLLINNHVRTHLRLSLLCTINGCFAIERSCNDMWDHINREHQIPSGCAAVPLSKKSKNKK